MESIFVVQRAPIEQGAANMGKSALDLRHSCKLFAIDITRGKVTNNRMEMLFEGVDRRSFSFTFRMMPKSEAEAIAVDKIVNMFRFYMAPSFEGAATHQEHSSFQQHSTSNTITIQAKKQILEQDFNLC